MLLVLLSLISVAFGSRWDSYSSFEEEQMSYSYDESIREESLRELGFGTHLGGAKLAGAILLISVGLFMNFFGKRFFKTLLGIIGFIAGAAAGAFLSTQQFANSLPGLLLYGLCGAIYGALLFASLWRTGVILLSTVAGFSVTTFLLDVTGVFGIKRYDIIAATIGAFVASILSYAYSKPAISIIMSVLGSGATTLAVDIIRGRRDVLGYILFPALAISGIVVQTVVYRNKKTQVDDLDAPPAYDRPAFHYPEISTAHKI